MPCSQMGRQNIASLKKWRSTIEATGWNKRDKSLGGGELGRRREKVFFWGSVQSDGESRKEKYLAGTVFHILGM